MMKPRFNIIYCDPPWDFATYSDKGKGRSAENHYSVMTIADICALPVAEIAAPDSILFLWANGPRLFEAQKVIEAWQFTYKSIGFVWVKTGKNGKRPIGCGYWTRANPEICLIATRGKPRRIDASIPTLIEAPRREHSRKPDEVRERIVRLVGDLPRVELFARQRVSGWDSWGDQTPQGSDIVLEAA
jgi:N6-adenosine-specific RNA methylase IME4